MHENDDEESENPHPRMRDENLAEARPLGVVKEDFIRCEVVQDFKMIPELQELTRGPESWELH
jgi:hypothetical protein